MQFRLDIENDKATKMTTLNVASIRLIAMAPTLTDAEIDLRDIIKRQMGIEDVDIDLKGGCLTLKELPAQATAYILRQFRISKDVSFSVLAKDLGYSGSSGPAAYFSETDPRLPSIAAFCRLCEYFGHPVIISSDNDC